jgi:diguanylate cyclase (GGDEF)-like protein
MTVAEHVSLAIANLKLRETLRSQSIRDPLTGLFNRRYMEESLEREMRRAARGHHPVGIIMLDLDDFKGFNDAHGHDAGDALLRLVGTTLQRSVRAEDIACRYGGEEFALILPEASLVDAVARAEAIRESVRALAIDHRRQQVAGGTISAGVAVYPEHGPTGHAVLRAADAALYQAKIAGRDCVFVNRGGLFVPAPGLQRE